MHRPRNCESEPPMYLYPVWNPDIWFRRSHLKPSNPDISGCPDGIHHRKMPVISSYGCFCEAPCQCSGYCSHGSIALHLPNNLARLWVGKHNRILGKMDWLLLCPSAYCRSNSWFPLEKTESHSNWKQMYPNLGDTTHCRKNWRSYPRRSSSIHLVSSSCIS
jgi:hypothetical protein